MHIRALRAALTRSKKTMVYRGMTTLSTFEHVADDALLTETKRLAADERLATARLIAALAEVDARRLYRGEGCSSLFVYCTRVLHLSEHAAYSRIEAARSVRRFPRILELLIAGDVTLTSVTLLAPHLTDDNCAAALEAARHKSKREVEVQVAALRSRSRDMLSRRLRRQGVTFLRASGARCGSGTADNVPSLAGRGAARSAAFWSFITGSRSPPVARRRSLTSRYDVAPTMPMRPSCSSDRSLRASGVNVMGSQLGLDRVGGRVVHDCNLPIECSGAYSDIGLAKPTSSPLTGPFRGLNTVRIQLKRYDR